MSQITYNILRETHSKRDIGKGEHVAKSWISYIKVYNMMPQRCITDYLEMLKISKQVIKFIMRAIENLRVGQKSGGQNRANGKI